MKNRIDKKKKKTTSRISYETLSINEQIIVEKLHLLTHEKSKQESK